jgi:hypothetical protein
VLNCAVALRFAFVLLLFAQASASASVINFEGPADSTPITNQYSGLTFADATILTAGISLNELEFPPHSGVNVVFDDSGPISITFSTPVLNVGGYFTYAEPLTLTAFGTGNNQVGQVLSLFNSNLALSGDTGSSPNEFRQLAFAGGIARVTIAGDPFGGSFVMDDLTYTPASTPVPEPASFVFLLTAAAVMVAGRRRRPSSR